MLHLLQQLQPRRAALAPGTGLRDARSRLLRRLPGRGARTLRRSSYRCAKRPRPLRYRGMKITRLETFVIGDGDKIDPDKGGVEAIACVRVHTDGGLSGLSEVFRVPPGVVVATVGGPETHFGACSLARS